MHKTAIEDTYDLEVQLSYGRHQNTHIICLLKRIIIMFLKLIAYVYTMQLKGVNVLFPHKLMCLIFYSMLVMCVLII